MLLASIDPGEYAATAHQPAVTDPGVSVIQVYDRPTAARVAVRDGVADVFLDGQSVGSATLTEADLVEGQVLLGISVSTVRQRPPYTVSFADVDIRSLQG